eukprot:CAMPEP_0184388902 /NCGR_PEP_ID=MMETSP0007-20130409/12027_1 /TAXON_ID=97485 /ORGANISM="Prymnesium parvum, Strain Texoma1" /LENGTH=43 /DNA_ID= /DNA_START= /DNA_END= /DNA_ORIENTATION=
MPSSAQTHADDMHHALSGKCGNEMATACKFALNGTVPQEDAHR